MLIILTLEDHANVIGIGKSFNVLVNTIILVWPCLMILNLDDLTYVEKEIFTVEVNEMGAKSRA